MDEKNLGVCVVCLEERPEDLYQGMCECKGIAVHAECFEKMLRVPSHRMRCAVCRSSYGFFVTEHNTTFFECASKVDVLIVSLLHTMFPLGVVGMWYIATYMLDEPSFVPAIALVTCTCATSCSMGLLIFSYGVFGCVQPRKRMHYTVDFGLLKARTTTSNV